MTAPSLAQLMEQRSLLEKQIAEMQRAAKAEAIAKIRSLMAEYGLSLSDLNARNHAAPKQTAKVAAKYRDPTTGQSWSGRGLKPKWLTAALANGHQLEEFAV